MSGAQSRPGTARGGGFRVVVGPVFWAVMIGWAGAAPTAGHDALGDSLRHEISLIVGPALIDVRVEVTFFQFNALLERRRMDADLDGRISPAESRAYLEKQAPMLEGGLRLTVDGRPVELAPLYDPRLDLPEEAAAASSHVLRLDAFARTPPWLAAGSQVVVEDLLWPRVPAIVSLEAAGRDGVRMLSEPVTEPAAGPDAAGVRRLRARCLGVPESARPASPPASDRPIVDVAGPSATGPRSFTDLWAGKVYFSVLILVLAGVAAAAAARRRQGAPS
ncbi:MAG: hypothetical protein AMXMBFR83_17850 [Phycisphaerae bacterium]